MAENQPLLPELTLPSLNPTGTSPGREEIEQVMASVDLEGATTVEARNERRRGAVEEFLDSDTGYNLDQRGPQELSLRNMILDDLESYDSWEES